MPIHNLKREGRRYGLGDFPVLPAFGMETFESQTLNFGGLEWGWAAGGVVTTYAGRTSYEDFETSTLNGGGNDFGWSGAGMLIFSPTATLSAAFADLGATVTITATTTGSGSFTYQWYQNGIALANGGEYSGVTTATLTITGVTSGDYTTYFCAVTCLGDTVNTNTVTLIDRATDWANRVVAAGGVIPGNTSITAARVFINGLISDGILASMFRVNIFAPDNLTACRVPLIGNTVWINNGFVAGDLSTGGLQGNGSKYLDTGELVTSIFSDKNNSGVTVYAPSLTNGNFMEMGGYDGTNFIGCRVRQGGASQGAICDNGNYAGSTYPGNGYFSFNRVSSTDLRAFFANSGNAHAQLGATVVVPNGGVIPVGRHMFVFCFDATGTPTWIIPDPLSFVAMHKGLSTSQSANFFTRIQTLRTSLGGGFV